MSANSMQVSALYVSTVKLTVRKIPYKNVHPKKFWKEFIFMSFIAGLERSILNNK
jgi:hypothetical protein